jgi:NADPH-dependent ferric siderophore reductase
MVHLLVTHPDAKVDLHRDVDVTWHVASAGSTSNQTLAAAIEETDLVPDMRIWAAGEAAAMHRIRRHLFEERGFPRSQATVRGYWKRNRQVTEHRSTLPGSRSQSPDMPW